MSLSLIKPWLLLSLIFVVGIVTGGALTTALKPRFAQPPGEQQMRNRWMMHLTDRLKLTADQQTKIQPILTDAEHKIQLAHQNEVGQVSQIIEKANDEIALVLTPDQQAELQRMGKEMDANREKMFPSHRHHGPHENSAPSGGSANTNAPTPGPMPPGA